MIENTSRVGIFCVVSVFMLSFNVTIVDPTPFFNPSLSNTSFSQIPFLENSNTVSNRTTANATFNDSINQIDASIDSSNCDFLQCLILFFNGFLIVK